VKIGKFGKLFSRRVRRQWFQTALQLSMVKALHLPFLGKRLGNLPSTSPGILVIRQIVRASHLFSMA
jgi:hypothetical protein